MQFDNIKYSAPTLNINLTRIPTTQIGLDEYNNIVRTLNALHNNNEINKGFRWTKSGGISISREHLGHNLNCFEVRASKSDHEIICVSSLGAFRAQYWHGANDIQEKQKMSGRKAIYRLQKEMEKDGINLEDYYIDNGKAIKPSIPSPLIGLTNPVFKGLTFEKCHHIDINSAYPYAMTLMYPEWTKTINRLYEKRHTNEVFKAVLNMSYGYFQSKYFNYNLANVSKFCIEWVRNKLLEVTKFLEENGCTVLAYNTDGIWYQGKRFMQFDEKQLGGLKTDYTNCKIRFKSDGAYEFYGIDTKTHQFGYHPVVRGLTTLDKVKPRNQWVWGDVMNATNVMLKDSETEADIIEVCEGGVEDAFCEL